MPVPQALQTVRLALRQILRSPASTAVAILSLAMSIGGTSVVFTALRSVLIEPLPYAVPERLVTLRTDDSGLHEQAWADWVSWNDMQDVIRENRAFESAGVYSYSVLNLWGDGGALPEALYGLKVSANLFETLGVKPWIGRNIRPEEEQPGSDRVIILSYGLWTRRFHSDRSIAGRTVRINGRDVTVIGVMAPAFDFPLRLATTVRTPSRHMEFWAPLAVDPARMERSLVSYGAVARLRPGSTLEDARRDLVRIAGGLAQAWPGTNRNRTLDAIGLADRTLGYARNGLVLLMGAALLFMLIGCANVANLLLARGVDRTAELAVRLALGAGRIRLVRQLVLESCLLGLLGGIAGYLLAAVIWLFLPAAAPATIPRLSAARADWTVFAFTLAIALVNGVLFGILPAVRASLQDPAIALRTSGGRGTAGRTAGRLRSALVAAEIGVAVVLVVTGGLLTAGFVRLLRIDPGFEADRVLASIIVPVTSYRTPERREVLFRRVIDAVRTLPGVEAAAVSDALPFSGADHIRGISTDEGEIASGATQQTAETDRVSAQYLQTLGVRLLEGRWFRDEEMDDANDSVIVNDVAASRVFRGTSPLGRSLCVECSAGKPRNWKQVVGVVAGIRHTMLDQPAGPAVYLAAGSLARAQFLVARTQRPPAELARAIRQAVAGIDPSQPVFLSATMSSLISDSVADRRFVLTVLAITSSLALLLAAAGVYGVVSYAASRRTREIGLRMALGAAPSDVYGMVLRQGIRMAGAGAIAGLLISLALARLLQSYFAGLRFDDPLPIVAAVAVVVATAGLASWLPAFRASRIAPMTALREE